MASSRKSQTKVGTLACFDFFKGMSKLCKNSAMLFHVDMVYLAEQAKRDVKKQLCIVMRTITKSNTERDFFSFDVKTKKVCRCFASFSSEQDHFTHGMYMTALIRPLDVKKSNRSCTMKECCQSYQAQ